MRRMEQYFPFPWSNPSQVIRFQSRENTKSNGGLFHLCLLTMVLLDDAEVEIEDALGEGDNVTFFVRIQKESATTLSRDDICLYFPDEFKSHFRMASELFIGAIMLPFHVAHMCFGTITEAAIGLITVLTVGKAVRNYSVCLGTR